MIDYFVTRSSAFRDVVARNLKNIAHSGGILRQSKGMYDSKAETLADQVQERVKGMIELWDHLYGIVYPSIHVMARFCRETMGLKMPNIVVFHTYDMKYCCISVFALVIYFFIAFCKGSGTDPRRRFPTSGIVSKESNLNNER